MIFSYYKKLTDIITAVYNPRVLQKLINHYEISVLRNTPLHCGHAALPYTTRLIRERLREDSFVNLRYEIFIFLLTTLREKTRTRKPTIHTFIKSLDFGANSIYDKELCLDTEKILFVVAMSCHVITYVLHSPVMFNNNFSSGEQEYESECNDYVDESDPIG